MNWKLIFGGGLLYYLAQFALSLVTGPLLHNKGGVLDPVYRQHESFWRPELNMVPPDMAALMPRWIGIGLVMAFVFAGLYVWIRNAFEGPGWLKGVKYGVLLGIVTAGTMASWSGIFNLPDSLWAWWAGEMLAMYLLGGAVLGWFAERFAAE